MTNIYDIKKIQAQVGYVIVRPFETEAEIAGIIQPKGDTEIPQWGEVIALGGKEDSGNNQAKYQTLDLKVGQTVIYRKWGGNDVTIGEKKYYFLKYEEIIGAVGP